MTTHELKLDIRYFDDVASGKKNFEIRKNDRDFQVGDILKLKAWDGKAYVRWDKDLPEYPDWNRTLEENADTITAEVTWIKNQKEIDADINRRVINGTEFGDPAWYWRDVKKVLCDYFHTDRLPDDYVVLGIEVIK